MNLRVPGTPYFLCTCLALVAALGSNSAWAKSKSHERKPAATLDSAVLPTPAAPSSGLTLEDCYAAAVKRSELIGNQVELIVQAEETFRQAYGSILPSINGSASRTWQEPVSSGSGS